MMKPGQSCVGWGDYRHTKSVVVCDPPHPRAATTDSLTAPLPTHPTPRIISPSAGQAGLGRVHLLPIKTTRVQLKWVTASSISSFSQSSESSLTDWSLRHVNSHNSQWTLNTTSYHISPSDNQYFGEFPVRNSFSTWFSFSWCSRSNHQNVSILHLRLKCT